MPETLPLTPSMRAALLAHRARNNRLIGWIFLALVTVIGIALAAAIAPSTLSPLDSALAVLAVLGPLVVFAAILLWANNGRARRALEEGTYRRYVGPPRAGYSSRGPNNTLILGSDRLPLNRSMDGTEAIFEQERVTVVYSVSAKEIFAIWDGAGRVIHQLPSYDPRDDDRVASPGTGREEWLEPPPARADALTTEGGSARRHPTAPGQYPLTPQMLECLKPVVGWHWVPTAVALGFGTFGGMMHSFGAPWYSFAPMYAIALLLLVAQFQGWRGGKRIYANAQAGGTYIRHLGFYILEPYGRSSTSIHWRIRVLDIVLTLPAGFEHDPAWLERSHPRGTLIYSPGAGTLFAVWDEAGRLVCRNRHYNLAGDALVAAPDPE
ncbi:MAG: hypothetical protein U0232_31735 [Thermomicrobiales bacterium]